MSREKNWKCWCGGELSVPVPDREPLLDKKETPLRAWAGFTKKSRSILPACALGCLKRINLCLLGAGAFGNMGSNIAITGFPFQRRIRKSCAIPSGRELGTAIAAIAFLHDLMANPAVVGTTLCSHQRALKAFSDGCTIHRNHPLSLSIELIKLMGHRFALIFTDK